MFWFTASAIENAALLPKLLSGELRGPAALEKMSAAN